MTKQILKNAEETTRTARLVLAYADTIGTQLEGVGKTFSVPMPDNPAGLVVKLAHVALAMAEDASSTTIAHSAKVLTQSVHVEEQRAAMQQARLTLRQSRSIVARCFGKATAIGVFGRGGAPRSYAEMDGTLRRAAGQLEDPTAKWTPLSNAALVDVQALAKELRDASLKLKAAHEVVSHDASDAAGKMSNRRRKAAQLQRARVNLRRLAESLLRFVGDDGLADLVGTHHHTKVEAEAPVPAPEPEPTPTPKG